MQWKLANHRWFVDDKCLNQTTKGFCMDNYSVLNATWTITYVWCIHCTQIPTCFENNSVQVAIFMISGC
jgi:hypothetical protein